MNLIGCSFTTTTFKEHNAERMRISPLIFGSNWGRARDYHVRLLLVTITYN